MWNGSFSHQFSWLSMAVDDIWGLCCRKQVSQAGISNYIPQFTVECNYLSLPEIPASGNKLWDVITYSCLRYLLLATKSTYITLWTNGTHHRDHIFNHISLIKPFCILIQISQVFFSKGPIDNKSALVQAIGWCCRGEDPLAAWTQQ